VRHEAVTTKTTNVMAMKTPLSSSSCSKGWPADGATNCGRNARKKIVSFGLRMLSRNALTTSRVGATRATVPSTAKALRSRQVAQAM
jgi:hypothetical protein